MSVMELKFGLGRRFLFAVAKNAFAWKVVPLRMGPAAAGLSTVNVTGVGAGRLVSTKSGRRRPHDPSHERLKTSWLVTCVSTVRSA